jgi:DNA-binding NarL/FixJ family response regulator
MESANERATGPARPDILIVKGHPCTAQLVRQIIESDAGLIEIVGEFHIVACGPKVGQTCLPLVVVDICQRCRPNFGSLEIPPGLPPLSRWLALMASGQTAVAALLLRVGYTAVVEVSDGVQGDLAAAVRAVMSGHSWAPPSVLAWSQKLTALEAPRGGLLTKRETQVLPLLLLGLSNKEIANSLTLSERTTKFHVSNILAKHHASCRRHLTGMCRIGLDA